MPWFTATAYLHSVMIQERRDMLKVWNMALVMLTYFLTVFGTFLTRSGLIDSVHTFAQSDVGDYFIAFLITLTIISIGLIVW
jgi:cytochrome c-type biogenesis protein CcmF